LIGNDGIEWCRFLVHYSFPEILKDFYFHDQGRKNKASKADITKSMASKKPTIKRRVREDISSRAKR